MIVVDTSVLIPLYLEHEHSEIANVFWKYVRLCGMELSLALEILHACLRQPSSRQRRPSDQSSAKV